MNIKANLQLPISELQKECGLDKGGRVQKQIDSFILYHSEPYLPGRHIHTPQANQLGSGQVVWNTPDANYLYEGKLMVDPFTLKGAFFSPNFGYWSRPGVEKIMDPSGKNLEYHQGGLRGPHWFDRMISKEMDNLLADINNAIGGK